MQRWKVSRPQSASFSPESHTWKIPCEATQATVLNDARIPCTAPATMVFLGPTQQEGQRVKQIALYPRVIHSCSSPLPESTASSMLSPPRLCHSKGPRTFHTSPVCAVHAARPALQSRPSPPHSLQSVAVSHLYWLWYFYQKEPTLPIGSHLRDDSAK